MNFRPKNMIYEWNSLFNKTRRCILCIIHCGSKIKPLSRIITKLY